jgi:hypothetical protein
MKINKYSVGLSETKIIKIKYTFFLHSQNDDNQQQTKIKMNLE